MQADPVTRSEGHANSAGLLAEVDRVDRSDLLDQQLDDRSQAQAVERSGRRPHVVILLPRFVLLLISEIDRLAQ